MLGANATIADEVQQLTKINAKLQRFTSKFGTKADGKSFRASVTRERQDAKALCQQIMAHFKQNTGADKRVLVKLKDQFQRELKKFSTVSEQIEKKEREAVIHITEDSGSRQGSRANPASAPRSVGDGYRQMQQEPEFEFLDYDAEEIKKRQEGIRQIEQDVVDVHEMFNDLQTLVVDQGEFIDNIEGNITAAKNKTAAAHGELVQAEKYQKSGRKKTCCLLVILVVVVAVVVLLVEAF